MTPARLPAAPLLEAIEEARRARDTSLRKLLGANRLRTLWNIQAEGTVTAHTGAKLCASIGRQPHALWGAAYEATRPAPKPDGHANIHLPAAPLLKAVEERCRGRGTTLRQLLGEPGKTPQREAYRRARRAGWLTVRAAEELCDFFGWHPRELWGDAYDAAALDGCPANFDPWEGIA
jgi:hypothetical protein